MLGDRHHKARPGLVKEFSPCGRVIVFGAEERDKLFVAKLGVRAIGLDVVFVFGGALDIHRARVPFIREGWHSVDAPVNKNSEFTVFIPGWNCVLGKRFPAG